MTGKRVAVCTALGLVAGILCWLGSYLAGGVPGGLTTPTVLAIIFNRGFLGLVIGLSAWRAPWALRGIVIGLGGSLPVAVYPLFSPEGFGPFLMYELAGGLWGFLIELGAKATGAAQK